MTCERELGSKRDSRKDMANEAKRQASNNNNNNNEDEVDFSVRMQ